MRHDFELTSDEQQMFDDIWGQPVPQTCGLKSWALSR